MGIPLSCYRTRLVTRTTDVNSRLQALQQRLRHLSRNLDGEECHTDWGMILRRPLGCFSLVGLIIDEVPFEITLYRIVIFV